MPCSMAMPKRMLWMKRCSCSGFCIWLGRIRRLAATPASVESVRTMLPSSRSRLKLTRYWGWNAFVST
ncbi:hypothetical protein D3C84_1147330 [compost metagenome]